MKSTSITKQAAFLMAGKILAMPLSFLVPVILVRYFTVAEFGHYKQLFLIFYVVLPIIDLGISNSLYYFIPKYPEIKNQILSHTFLIQFIMCSLLVICFYLFDSKISFLMGESKGLTEYIPYIGIFAALWHFSTILEVILIAEKNAFMASVISFSSDVVRSLFSIIVVVFISTNLKDLLLYGLILTGVLRLLFMIIYITKRGIRFWAPMNKELLISQISYSLPFGIAVIVMGFVSQSHQYIVTLNTDASMFAIYSVGCFQLPFLGIILGSVAKASLVRMTELSNAKNGKTEIALIISNSIRKLWIIFFPVFVFLLIHAEEVIILLYTESYRESIPIFRVVIFMIPLNAILLSHVPRIFAETKFILLANVLLLILSLIFCYIFVLYLGIIGGAIGFILATIAIKVVFLFKCQKMLDTTLNELIPVKCLCVASLITFSVSSISLFIKMTLYKYIAVSLIISSVTFFPLCLIVFWRLDVLSDDEKELVCGFKNKILNSLKKIKAAL